MLKELATLVRGAGTPEERTARVWEVVDTAAVDRLLVHNAEAAHRSRRLWQASNPTYTGAMHRALRRQSRHPTPLLDDLPSIGVPTPVLAGLRDRNVGVETCRGAAGSIPDGWLVVFARSAHFPGSATRSEEPGSAA